eukprot:jgi/Phyca11/512183/fgenesh2_kg.PHYCAscaffold_466_\
MVITRKKKETLQRQQEERRQLERKLKRLSRMQRPRKRPYQHKDHTKLEKSVV